MLSEEELVGAWRLVAHFYLADDGSTSEGPLGDEAEGLLIYHADGYMAASMMRTKPHASEDGSPPATYLGSADDYLGYSGRWRLDDGAVVHDVTVGSHPRVVNTRQIREVRLHDGCLSLRRRLDGPHRYVIMDWRRA